MTSLMTHTVAQINQSVDQKLESGLADIQQRLEQKLESDQRARSPSSTGKATPTPAETEKLIVSEETIRQVVKKAFHMHLPLQHREEGDYKGRAPDLDLAETRCPRLDPQFKTGESKFAGNTEAKQVDNDLQKIQTLMLDVTAPLLELKEFVEAGEGTPLPRHSSETVNDALKLLENAVVTTSKLRRKRILKACNPDIQDLAEEESL